ncbi:MAG TPA: hypothetical protein VIG57_04185 [Candidatus Entotheonella sp.]|jgi:hypothetical protein
MYTMTRYGFGSQWPVVRFALMGVLMLSLLPCRQAQSQPQTPFTDASLQGHYALVGTGGNHTAASVGIEIYDGQGNVTRTLVLNEREADHTRKVVRITGQGTYRVQPNGMGTATIVNTLPDGSTFTSHLDFVITQATPASTHDEKVATEVFAILQETGIAAPLVTFVLTRLPD